LFPCPELQDQAGRVVHRAEKVPDDYNERVFNNYRNHLISI